MKKSLNIAWKVFLILIVCLSLVAGGYIYSVRDELVTSKITMKYFVETVELNDKNRAKSFVANSNNDVLYKNFVSTLDNIYYYDGVENVDMEITNIEIFGNGKYQCYFSNALEDYTPKCDLENEGRYVNYLVDINIKYNIEQTVVVRKEKGLVVFVKDPVQGNYFTWKLVRFDRYKIDN
jgi:hypothetical protein